MIGIIALMLAAASPDTVVIEIKGAGLRSTTVVNGFDASGMTEVHPYFLRANMNALRIDYVVDEAAVGDGPWTLRVRALNGDVELVSQSGPTLTRADTGRQRALNTSFKLGKTLPSWDWMTSAPVGSGEVAKNTLYAEYQKLWAVLNGMPSASVEQQAAFQAMAKRETADFIKASQAHGVKYEFVEDLIVAAVKGGLAPLPAVKDLKMSVFAEGRLARLDGATFTLPTVAFQAWYRKTSKGVWELDALVPVAPAAPL